MKTKIEEMNELIKLRHLLAKDCHTYYIRSYDFRNIDKDIAEIKEEIARMKSLMRTNDFVERNYDAIINGTIQLDTVNQIK